MELNISEISDSSMSSYDQIPENMAPIKVIKRQQQQQAPVQSVKPSLSGVKAKMVRPQTPAPKPKLSYDDILAKMGMFVADGKLHLLDGKPKQQVEQITKQIQQPVRQQQQPVRQQQQPVRQQQQPVRQEQQPVRQQQQPVRQEQPEQVDQRNSYIYNKYFNNEPTEQQDVRRPQSVQEYRDMLIRDILQKHRIRQMKSSKLIMPTSNINFAQGGSGNLNKLFLFSQR
jgi:hypothetical protein